MAATAYLLTTVAGSTPNNALEWASVASSGGRVYVFPNGVVDTFYSSTYGFVIDSSDDSVTTFTVLPVDRSWDYSIAHPNGNIYSFCRELDFGAFYPARVMVTDTSDNSVTGATLPGYYDPVIDGSEGQGHYQSPVILPNGNILCTDGPVLKELNVATLTTTTHFVTHGGGGMAAHPNGKIYSPRLYSSSFDPAEVADVMTVIDPSGWTTSTYQIGRAHQSFRSAPVVVPNGNMFIPSETTLGSYTIEIVTPTAKAGEIPTYAPFYGVPVPVLSPSGSIFLPVTNWCLVIDPATGTIVSGPPADFVIPANGGRGRGVAAGNKLYFPLARGFDSPSGQCLVISVPPASINGFFPGVVIGV